MYVIVDIVSQVWIGDKKILHQYIAAKRAEKAKPSVFTKLNRKAAAKNLRPALQLLKTKILKGEQDAAIVKFSTKGVLPMESVESTKVIKAIDHMFKQL